MGVGLQPDTGWADVGTAPTIASLAPGDYVDVYVPWVPSTPDTLGVDTPDRFAYHSCFRVQMNTVAGEYVTANQDGDREQENITYFEIRRDAMSLTYAPVERSIFLSNLGSNFPRVFWLGIESELPDDWSLTVGDGASRIVVPAGDVVTVPVQIEVPFGTDLDLAYRVRVAAYEEVPGDRFDTHMSLVSALVIDARTVPDSWVGLRTVRYAYGNGQITAVSACLGAPLSEEQLVTIDYVRASGAIVPQGVETYANGCFVSYLYTASDHPTRARAIWHGAAEFSRTISQDVNPTASDCCTSTAASGCAYPSIEECVCAVDDYCCLNHWDSICVGEVTSLGCGACHAACSTGAAQAREDDIEACVCARDTYCCTTAWDSLCVDEVDSFGCGTCGASMMSSAGSEIESTTAEEFETQRAGDVPPEPTLPPER